MDTSIHETDLTGPRVGYATRYENQGPADGRQAAVTARAARAMRDGDRHMDGSPRTHPTQANRQAGPEAADMAGGTGGNSRRPSFPAGHDPCRCELPACRSGFPEPAEAPPEWETRQAAEPLEDFTQHVNRRPSWETEHEAGS
jgi:hypothetical protein